MILVYFLVSILPYSKHPLWSNYFGDVTIIKYVGLACFIYALLYLTARGTRPIYFASKQSRWFLIYFALTAVSYFTLGAPFSMGDNPFISYLSFFLFFFVTLTVVDSMARLRWVLLVAIGSVSWASLYVLREWQKYGGTVRPGWIVGDSNYFTASALLCLPLAYNLAAESRRPQWERLFCIGCIVMTMMAVTVGASRGGFLGLVAASMLIVLRSQRPLRNILVVTAVLLPMSVLSPVSPLGRLLSPTELDQRSADARTMVWAAGVHMFMSSPLTGIGLGNYKELVALLGVPNEPLADGAIAHVAHNTYVEILAEIGVAGLVAFLAMLTFAFVGLERVQRRTEKSGPVLVNRAALGLQAGLLAFVVAAFFVSAQYQKLFWLMLFLSMCLPALVRQNARTERAPEPAGGSRLAARTGSGVSP